MIQRDTAEAQGGTMKSHLFSYYTVGEERKKEEKFTD